MMTLVKYSSLLIIRMVLSRYDDFTPNMLELLMIKTFNTLATELTYTTQHSFLGRCELRQERWATL